MAQVKRIRRDVSGIIILDKPRGFTSNAALQKVRWLLNAEKAGHTGSLDPLATGVLPLCFGEATKFSQYLLDADKGYETVAQLGVTTTTADAEGEVIERKPVSEPQRTPLHAFLRRLSGVARRFLGLTSTQVPVFVLALTHAYGWQMNDRPSLLNLLIVGPPGTVRSLAVRHNGFPGAARADSSAAPLTPTRDPRARAM